MNIECFVSPIAGRYVHHINSFSFLFLLTEGLKVGVIVGPSDGLCIKFAIGLSGQCTAGQ